MWCVCYDGPYVYHGLFDLISKKTKKHYISILNTALAGNFYFTRLGSERPINQDQVSNKTFQLSSGLPASTADRGPGKFFNGKWRSSCPSVCLSVCLLLKVKDKIQFTNDKWCSMLNGEACVNCIVHILQDLHIQKYLYKFFRRIQEYFWSDNGFIYLCRTCQVLLTAWSHYIL